MDQSTFLDQFKAADKGDASSQYELGKMYEKGDGVTQNSVQAYKWFTIAAAQGHFNAEESRKNVATNMTAGQIAEAERLTSEWKQLHPQ